MNKITKTYPNLSDLPSPPADKVGWPWTEETSQLRENIKADQSWPRISIVTPSYNQAEYIEETIRSVLLQGYPNLEYLIIDGGSSDGSVDIIRNYERWLTYWVSEPDAGQADAINKGMTLATGEILGYLNSDDYLLPRALQTIVKFQRKNLIAGGWFGGCIRVNQVGERITERWPQEVNAEGIAHWEMNWVQQPACFFSRQAWKVSGPFDKDLYSVMDFDFWLKLAAHFDIVKVNQLLAAARIYDEAKSIRHRKRLQAETFAVLIRHGFEEIAINGMIDRLGEPEVQEIESLREESRKRQSEVEHLTQELQRIRTATLLSAGICRANDYMAVAYRAYEKREWSKLKPALWGALRHDPTWLGRRGFLSMLAKAYGLRGR